MATGVLVLGVGKATRLLHHLLLADKAYSATVRLGQSTVSDDADGALVGCVPAAGLDPDAVRASMRALTGDIAQVPSAVSAIKVSGQRSYQRVREGTAVDLAARAVTVRRFEALTFAAHDDVLDVDVAVECSSGTYVRALARDVGASLGVGAHLIALRRTRVGPFTVEDARTLPQLADLPDPVTLPLAAAVRAAMPVRTVDDAEARELAYGRPLTPQGRASTYAAITGAGQVIALLRDDDAAARPVLVFTAAG